MLELSYGTRLPVVDCSPTSVEVAVLDGRHLYLKRSVVALHTPGTPWPTLTGTTVVAEARRFLGLQFLYGGTSGFGFDCSGLAHSVFRALGKTIPRDADAQSAHGLSIVSRAALRPGDLVFFRDVSGHVHHVGMYAGNGTMLHSPHTGAPVSISSIYREPFLSEFAGGRRYVVSAPNAACRPPATPPR